MTADTNYDSFDAHQMSRAIPQSSAREEAGRPCICKSDCIAQYKGDPAS
jgi:hypothetical protein